jgi:hypothetical protein
MLAWGRAFVYWKVTAKAMQKQPGKPVFRFDIKCITIYKPSSLADP